MHHDVDDDDDDDDDDLTKTGETDDKDDLVSDHEGTCMYMCKNQLKKVFFTQVPGLCSRSAQMPQVTNFCPWANGKSYF